MPRQGQKFVFRDLNIEENALFLNKKGACFTLKGHFLLRKKGTFWVLEFFFFFFFFWGGGSGSAALVYVCMYVYFSGGIFI